jgi:hypothetical protein
VTHEPNMRRTAARWGLRGRSRGRSLVGERFGHCPKFSAQAEILCNPRAVREATIASILDESAYLLGGVTVHASIAQQFAELGDVRGFLYSLDRVVEQAIRTGAEGVELPKIRKEMREPRR